MTSRQIRVWAALGVLAGVVSLNGCGSQEDVAAGDPAAPTGTPAQTATAAPAIPAALVGSWDRRMRSRDWRSVGRGYPLGTWRSDVTKNGDLSVYLPRTDTVDFATAVKVDGQRLTIDGIPVCPGQNMELTWQATERALTLSVVDDGGCKQGAALFGGTWTRR
jgi:hypothetical protein